MKENDFRNLYKCITRLYHKGIISNSESLCLIKRLFILESEEKNGKNEKNAECGK